jgi:hypothetical protein
LVGNEPDKTTYPKSHSAWDDLRKWNKLEYLTWDEIDKEKNMQKNMALSRYSENKTINRKGRKLYGFLPFLL